MAIYLIYPKIEYCKYCSHERNNSGPYKIGYAKDPIKRLKELQTGSPIQLEILFVLPGERDMESILHRLFAGKRSHGEWFDLSDKEVFLLHRLHLEGLLVKGKEEQLAEVFVDYLLNEVRGDDLEAKMEAAETILGCKAFN